jgi:predicted permease
MNQADYIQNLFQDLRYGFRIIIKNPAFALVIVLTLGVGIGVNTAIFSLVNQILLQPLPYPHQEQLVGLTEYYPKGALPILREQCKTMDIAAVWPGEEFNLAEPGHPPVRLNGAMVSAELFSVLGVNAQQGRTFHSGEDLPGNNQVIILSQEIWQNQFGGDRNIVGQWITIEGESRQVVGIMPADFTYPSPETKLWIPLKLDPQLINDYWGPEMPFIGRLRAGATPEQARQEVQSLIPTILSAIPFPKPPDWNKNSIVISLQQSIVGDVRTTLFIFLGAVGLVLLMACTNVANLLLARSASRHKEIALRIALGAGRWRIIRQLLTESVLLALCSGALGIFLGTQGLVLLKSLLPANTPRLADVTIDWRVLIFTVILAILTGLIFGLAPALNSLKVNLTESLNAGGRRSSGGKVGRQHNALIVIEMGLAVILVISSGLLIKSLWLLGRTNPGFRAENILTVKVSPDRSFCQQQQPCINFYEDLLQRIKTLPGVESVAAINALPLSKDYPVLPLTIEGYHPDAANAQAPLVWAGAITSEYHQIMGISLQSGRSFTDYDRADTQGVVLLTASTAERFWPGQDPIGKHIKPVWDKEWRTVVGVVNDVKQYALDQNRPGYLSGEIYMPYAQAVTGRRKFPVAMNLVLRTTGEQRFLAQEISNLTAGLSSNAPVTDLRTMKAVISASISTPNSVTWLFVIFSGLALLLGAIGLYSLISFSVAARTHEVGIRMALGATSKDVLKMIIGQGMVLTLSGIGVGLVAALGLTRLLSSLLYSVQPFDITIFAIAPVVLLIVALLASSIPALRATRVDPMIALRAE